MRVWSMACDWESHWPDYFCFQYVNLSYILLKKEKNKLLNFMFFSDVEKQRKEWSQKWKISNYK